MSTAAPPAAAAPDAAPAATRETATAQVTVSSGVRCDICGAPVPLVYCGTCGQRVEPPVHSLWHFVTVTAEELTHADSRQNAWITAGKLLLLSVFYLVSGVLMLALTSFYSAVTLA